MLYDAKQLFHERLIGGMLLLLATVSVAIAADAEKEIQPELKPAESALPIRVHEDEHRYRFKDGLELIRSREQRTRQHFDDYRDSRHNNYRYGHDDRDERHGHDDRDDRHGHDGRDDRHGHDGPVRLDFKEKDISGPLILRTPDPLPHHGHPDIERQNKIIADVYSPDYYQPTWILDYRYMKTGGRDYTRGPGGQILILPKNVRTNEHKEFPDFDSLLEHLRLSRLAERTRHRGHGHGDEHDARRGNQNLDYIQYGRGQQVYQQHNPWRANRFH